MRGKKSPETHLKKKKKKKKKKAAECKPPIRYSVTWLASSSRSVPVEGHSKRTEELFSNLIML